MKPNCTDKSCMCFCKVLVYNDETKQREEVEECSYLGEGCIINNEYWKNKERENMITIKKSKNADTRTCDWSKVSEEELLFNSRQHISDVDSGMAFFASECRYAGRYHDRTKLTHIKEFHEDFKNCFKEGHTSWWEMHQREERHHLKNEEFIQDDINFIDILEQITDGIMAGLARSGEYRQEPISKELLEKAYNNTIKLLLAKVRVEP